MMTSRKHWKLELTHKEIIGTYSFETKKAMEDFYKTWKNNPNTTNIVKLGKVDNVFTRGELDAKRIAELEAKLAIAIKALEWINKSESGVAELTEALTKIKGE